MKHISITIATLAALATISPANSEPAQQCLDKVVAFEAQAKAEGIPQISPGEREAFKDFLKWTVYDMKVICVKDDMDGALQIIFTEACPNFSGCNKIKSLIDRGLTADEKSCIGRVVDGINQNAEMKRQFALRLPAEAGIALAAIGGHCWGK